MPRKVRVIERKLKREKVDGQVFLDEGLIEIDPRLPPRDWLSTLVHEGLHIAYPDMPEKSVAAGEKKIVDILWRYNVRRTHQ